MTTVVLWTALAMVAVWALPHRQSDRPITRWAVGPPWDSCNRRNRHNHQWSEIPGGVAAVLRLQYAWQWSWGTGKHITSFHSTTVFMVVSPPWKLWQRVNKEGPTWPPFSSGPWGSYMGHMLCPPVCMHPSSCTAWTGPVQAKQELPLTLPLQCLFNRHRSGIAKEPSARDKKSCNQVSGVSTALVVLELGNGIAAPLQDCQSLN